MKISFYCIWLLQKNKIEIFQWVFSHNIIIQNNEMKCIDIMHGESGPGSFTNSRRPLAEVYEIKIKERPLFLPESSRPLNKIIIIDGKIMTDDNKVKQN